MFHFEIPASPAILDVHLPNPHSAHSHWQQSTTATTSLVVDIQIGDLPPK
jgi:hypothetical protein